MAAIPRASGGARRRTNSACHGLYNSCEKTQHVADSDFGLSGRVFSTTQSHSKRRLKNLYVFCAVIGALD